MDRRMNNMVNAFLLLLVMNTQGSLGQGKDDSEMEKYWLKQMKEELKVELDQLREKLEDQNTEIQLLKEDIRELSNRAAAKDHEGACAFTHRWSKEGKTINYDYLLSPHTNSGRFYST